MFHYKQKSNQILSQRNLGKHVRLNQQITNITMQIWGAFMFSPF